MANVLFKRGHHANLPVSGTSAVIDGAFYLTDDTNRLYVGQGTNLVELNKSITTVASIDNLPNVSTVEVGQFYYVTGSGTTAANNTHNGNILAVVVADGSGQKRWVQVNPDTDNGFNYNNSATFSNGVVDSNAHTVTYTLTINAKHRPANGDGSTDLTTGFDGATTQAILTINANDITGIVSQVSVGVSATLSNSNETLTIATTGANADSSNKVVLKAGSNIEFSSVTGGIEVSATDTTYGLSFSGTANTGNTDGTAGFTFSENGSSMSTVNFEAGAKLNVSGTTSGGNKVTYSHETISAPTATDGGAATVDSSVAEQESFTVVTGVTTDGYGHATGYTTKTVTTHDHQYTAGAITTASNGRLTTTLLDSSGTATGQSATSGNILYNTITVWNSANPSTTPTAQTVYNQGDLGTFYSKEAIDNMIGGLDALTYKGIADTTHPLPSTGVHNGDVYMVSEETGITIPGTSPAITAAKGDLLIAVGTETNGVITSGLTWTHVPSGKDVDTTYTFSVADNSLKVAVNNDPAETKLTIAGGTALTASTSSNTITLNHDNIANADTIIGSSASATKEVGANGSNATKTVGYGGTFVVPKVTVNKQGHVIGLGQTTIQLPDTDNTTYSLTTATNNSVAQLKLMENGTTAAGTISINGDSGVLSVAAGTNALTITHADVLGSTKGDNTTYYGNNSSTTLSAAGSIIIPKFKVTAEGHISDVINQPLTLPSDTTYTLTGGNTTTTSNSTDGNGVTTQFTLNNQLDNSASTHASFLMRSKSLTISKPDNTTNIVQVELEWGTFE